MNKYIDRAYLVKTLRDFRIKLQEREVGTEQLTTAAYTLREAVNELDEKQGDASLQTSAVDLSAAVNELLAYLKGAFGLTDVTYVTFKSSLIYEQQVPDTVLIPVKMYRITDGFTEGGKYYNPGTIAYAFSTKAGGGGRVYDWQYLSSENNCLGDLTTLTTTEKDTLVAAINEHDAEIGDLPDLQTHNKDTLVEAINEAYLTSPVFRTTSYDDFIGQWQHQNELDVHSPITPEFNIITDDEFMHDGHLYYAGAILYGYERVRDTDITSQVVYTLKWHVLENANNQFGDIGALQTINQNTLVEAINEVFATSFRLETCDTFAQFVNQKQHLHITDITQPFTPKAITIQEDFVFNGKQYYKGSIIYGSELVRDYDITSRTEYTLNWKVIENVDQHLGDYTKLLNLNVLAHDNVIDTVVDHDEEIGKWDEMIDRVKDKDALDRPLKTNMIHAINNNGYAIETLEQEVEEIEDRLAIKLEINGECTMDDFWNGDLSRQTPDTHTTADGTVLVVPKMYRITNAAISPADGKFYNAGSLVFAAGIKFISGRYIYDWKMVENVDGTIGDLRNLTTYEIDPTTGQIIPATDTIVNAVNANKTLIGALEEIDPTSLAVGGIEVGTITCVSLLLQDIIDKIGTMSDLDTYEKTTLMAALISAIRYIGTKDEQTLGINLAIDDTAKTLIAAVNALGNWLGNPKIFENIVGDGTKDLTSVVYELVTSEIFNHVQIQSAETFQEFVVNHQFNTLLKKADTFIITDDFEWLNESGKPVKYKGGSWMYLYNTVGGNDWRPLNNGGGNDFIYEQVSDKPTEDIKTDVIYVIPNAKGIKECWLYLGLKEGQPDWLLISSDSEGGSAWVGEFTTGKYQTSFNWDELTPVQLSALLSIFVASQGVTLKNGHQVTVIYSDRILESGPEPYILRGIWSYNEAANTFVPVLKMPIGSESEIGIVKLASEAEYGDKATGVAVQPSQIKTDLEDNYYKNTEVDELLKKKADDALVYKKEENYNKTEVDNLLKTLTRSKFVDFDPEKASPAVIAQYYGYQLYYGNDTDGYEVYLVDTDGTVKHVGTMKMAEDGFVKVTDPKYLTLSDIRQKDEEGNKLTVQIQIDNKQDLIPDTSAISNLLENGLTANRALISSSTGKVVVSKITNTELGYLEGVKENIQDQIDNISSGAAQSGWNIGDVKMSMQRTQRAGDWLLCDGNSYPQSDYADLYDVIGRSFSEPSLDATLFRVPNMCGKIPRGVVTPAKVATMDYADRYQGADEKTLLRTDLPNTTIYTDTDNSSYDGRHGHARGDFSWYSAGSHTHNIQFNSTNKSGTDTATVMSYSENRFGRKSPAINDAAGAHTHYKDASNGTYISSGTTSSHQHKIKLNGGVTQTKVNVMQATTNLCNFYIKFK